MEKAHDIPLDATASETIDILRERYYVNQILIMI